MMLLWCFFGENGYFVGVNDVLLYDFVCFIVLFLLFVFGFVICFDNYLYKNYIRFCLYVFRDFQLNGSVYVIDIVSVSVGYDYIIDKNVIWWYKLKSKVFRFSFERIISYYEECFNIIILDVF